MVKPPDRSELPPGLAAGLIAVAAVVAVGVVGFAWNGSGHTGGGTVRIPERDVETPPMPPGVVGPNMPSSAPSASAAADPTMDAAVAGDLQALDEAMAAQGRDERAAIDEVRVRTEVMRAMPTASALTVDCSTTTCRLSGTAAGDGDETRRRLVSRSFLTTLTKLGYSPGPDSVVAGDGGARVTLFLNRET